MRLQKMKDDHYLLVKLKRSKDEVIVSFTTACD